MNKEAYEAAYRDFVPATEDNPENVPFYRAWAALKALLIIYGYPDPYKAPINAHSICCWEHSGDYNAFVKILPMHTPKEPVKVERMRCRYYSEPNKPTEKDAYEIFSRNYKLVFPGKRLNSKHAKEKWIEKRDMAFTLANEDYAVLKRDYEAKVKHQQDKDDKEAAEFQAKVAEYQEAIELIEKLSKISDVKI